MNSTFMLGLQLGFMLGAGSTMVSTIVAFATIRQARKKRTRIPTARMIDSSGKEVRS